MTFSRSIRVGRILRAAGLGGVVVAVLAGCTLFAQPSDSPESTATRPATVRPTEQPSFAPTATVTIAQVDIDGRNLTVGGFVSGISESGGTCSFWATSEATGAVVKVTETGIMNSGTTSCGSTNIAVSKLKRGAWRVALHYRSPALTLTSEGLQVEVP